MKCEEIISAYIEGIRGGFACRPASDNRLRIITPYLYPDHDRIELFVREKQDGVVVSDLGETLRHLASMGMDVQANENRWYQVEKIVAGLSVDLRNGIIFKRATPQNIGEAMFDVLAACKSVADLVYGSRAFQPSTFDEEVGHLLEEENWHVERNVPIRGNSETVYRVPFAVFGAQRDAVVSIISVKPGTSPRSKINATFRMWADIDGGRSKWTLLNDENSTFRPEDVQLLSRWCKIHRWSERQEFVSALHTHLD